MNNDNRPDIILTNLGSNTIGVLLNTHSGLFLNQTKYATGIGIHVNTGNGTFSPQTIYSIGYSSYSVAVADMNNYKKSNVIVTNTGSNNVGVLFNTSNGSFPAQTTYSVGSTPRALYLSG